MKCIVCVAAALLLAAALGLGLAANQPVGGEAAVDERILHDADIAVDGPSLIKYFRDRTANDADPERMAQLIEQLGDASFGVRERASQELLAVGAAALESLGDEGPAGP